MNSYVRIILDEIFGENNLVNQIVWKRRTNTVKGISKKFSTNTDYILFFSKSENYSFNLQYGEYPKEYYDRFKYEDEYGKYRWQVMATFSKERMEKLKIEGKFRQNSGSSYPEFKQYLHELKGRPVEDIWDDINMINAMGSERENYPTQKPEALLERVIKASTNPGDLVMDCFMGSGTTQAVAMKLVRRFIGADINLGAIQTTTKRLLSVAKELKSKEEPTLIEGEEKPLTYYTGLEVYNVNDYDIFRNPVQAKELLIEALEIQPITTSELFDGEKDGYNVKIMPVNRIATKEDLNEIITRLNYKKYEREHSQNPNKAVDHIMLVCMGHDPELKAELEMQVSPYKIDIQIVDILRDREDLRFKREAEAKIITKKKGNKQFLVIKQFYPLNLMQKLSMEKTKVENWKELVETIYIDFYYDGSVLEPTILDIPEKNGLVKGEYEIPDDAGKIRVKITDLISESLEVDIELED